MNRSVEKINLSHTKVKLIICTLVCLMPIMGMAVDLIAPSLPSITINLKISEVLSKNIITSYLFGFGLGNFITGFITDAWGRQKLIRAALLGFVISSFLPILYPNINLLLFSRLAQGITIGSVAVLLRTILADILPPEKIIGIGILLGTMWGIGPIIGPIIGGYLQLYFGWHASFYFFTVISLVELIFVFLIIPETHFNKNTLNLKTIKSNIVEIISCKQFMAMPLIMGIAYSMVITFHTAGPFLIQTTFHYSPVFFGRLALWMGICFLLATFTGRHLLKYYDVEKIFCITTSVFTIFALFSLALSCFWSYSLLLLSITSSLMFFADGILFPMAMGKGLSIFRHLAGTATAIMYLINGIISGSMSFLMGFIYMKNSIPMMALYLIFIFLCLIIYLKLIHKKNFKSQSK